MVSFSFTMWMATLGMFKVDLGLVCYTVCYTHTVKTYYVLETVYALEG